MKIMVVILALMIVVSFIYGFDFSRYNVSDLSTYPELDYDSVVHDFADASYGGITSAFGVLQDISETIFFIFT